MTSSAAPLGRNEPAKGMQRRVTGERAAAQSAGSIASTGMAAAVSAVREAATCLGPGARPLARVVLAGRFACYGKHSIELER
jgi:hypothetical protein